MTIWTLWNILTWNLYAKMVASPGLCFDPAVPWQPMDASYNQCAFATKYMKSAFLDCKVVYKNFHEPSRDSNLLSAPRTLHTNSPWTLHTTHVLLQLYIWKLCFLTVNLYTKISTNQVASTNQFESQQLSVPYLDAS